MTATRVKTWELELNAAGSTTAIAAQSDKAAKLVQVCRDSKRLKEEVEVLREASVFPRNGRRNPQGHTPHSTLRARR